MKQLILFLLCLSTWTAQAKIYNVKDYGAKARSEERRVGKECS